MLSPIAGVREGLGTARVLAGVRFFPCMTPEVRLQILQAGVCFTAAFELENEKVVVT